MTQISDLSVCINQFERVKLIVYLRHVNIFYLLSDEPGQQQE